MKNNLLKYYIAAIYFGFTLVLFAQPGTEAEPEGDALESVDGAPINDYVWVLAAIGMLLVFLKFRELYKKEVTS
jgi:hypothetical protein